MKLTILYSDYSPSDYHRLLMPAKYLSGCKLVRWDKCEAEDLDCDILLFSRLPLFSWDVIKEHQRKFGFKVVVDFDDYYRLQPYQLRFKQFAEHDVTNKMILSAKNADIVFVTTEPLYRAYREFNKNVMIVPNALDFSIDPPEREQSDKVRFMYVAGKSHYHDLILLKGLFQRLRSDSQYLNRATFTLCGYDPAPDKLKISDKMESIVKAPNYIRRNVMPLDSYMDHYRYGDISIAPLVRDTFNEGKSNLKFLEAAYNKQCFVCSASAPYSKDWLSLIEVCETTADWYKIFKYYLNNPAAASHEGIANYDYAKKKYNLEDINELRMQAFSFTGCTVA